MTRKFSIIIPSCCFGVLRTCLDSIVRYTDFRKSDVEVICALNGCEPEARDYIDRLGPHFSYVWDDDKVGLCTAINNAVRRSSGEYIIRLDDDCEVLPWGANSVWLDLLETPFDLDRMVGCTGMWLQDHPCFDDHSKDKRAGGPVYQAFVGFFFMVPRTIWDEVGGFDETLNPGVGEDTDFGIKVCCLGYKMSIAGDRVDTNSNDNVPHQFPLWHKSAGWSYYDHKLYMDIGQINHKKLLERWAKPEQHGQQ